MIFVIFYLGCIFGSFINCIINRIINHKLLLSRSECDYCHHKLCILDLIPIFSFIFLKGRCRYCKEKININNLIFEILTGLLFIIVYLRFGLSFKTVIFDILILISISICIYDFRLMIIPNLLIVIGIIVKLIYDGFIEFSYSIDDLIQGIIICLPLLILVKITEYIFKKEMMGMGDIKLIFMFTMYFGIYGSLYSIIFACIFALIKFLLLKNNTIKIPFGPYICLGYILTFLLSSNMQVLSLI